ncbi:MAG: hypothetical protein HEQ32_07325 [Vampirovibrio sp.]
MRSVLLSSFLHLTDRHSARQGGGGPSAPDDSTVLMEGLLLPTAQLSQSLIDNNQLLAPPERHPQEARSTEESILLSYVQNRHKHQILSILDGSLLGIATGALTALSAIPVSILMKRAGLLKHFSQVPQKDNRLQFLKQQFLFRGFYDLAEADNKLLASLSPVLRTSLFGAVSGFFLSLHLARHQTKEATHLADLLHQEKEPNTQANQGNKTPPSEKVMSYPEWKSFAENGNHQIMQALKFNFLISTTVLGLQMLSLFTLAKAAQKEQLHIKKMFQLLVNTLENPHSPLRLLNLVEHNAVQWIKEKNKLSSSQKIHEAIEAELPTAIQHMCLGRFNLLNIARLSMLSLFMAAFWVNKNKTHIKNVEMDVVRQHIKKEKSLN